MYSFVCELEQTKWKERWNFRVLMNEEVKKRKKNCKFEQQTMVKRWNDETKMVNLYFKKNIYSVMKNVILECYLSFVLLSFKGADLDAL